MFRHILVPLDGSIRAEQALPVAARMARASRGSLTLVTVVTPAMDVIWQSGEPIPSLTDTFEQDYTVAMEYLNLLASSEILSGIPVFKEVLSGNPAQAILSQVETRPVDLIVLCSHGRTGVARWIMGSVAQRIARHSPIPVLILRQNADVLTSQIREEGKTVQIMVALDGSTFAECALVPAAELSKSLSAPEMGALHLVQVLPLVIAEGFAPGTLVEGEQSPAFEDATAYMQRIQHRLQGEEDTNALRITSSVLVDLDAAHALVTMAEQGRGEEKQEQKSDIIALATHGRGALGRFVMGSIADRVLTATKLPLLIIRPGKATELLQKAKDQGAQPNDIVNALPGR